VAERTLTRGRGRPAGQERRSLYAVPGSAAVAWAGAAMRVDREERGGGVGSHTADLTSGGLTDQDNLRVCSWAEKCRRFGPTPAAHVYSNDYGAACT
jgi:hypothetical protein